MKVFSIKRLTLGAALCIPLASAWGQAATATQQYLGAPLPNPVMAVELDAAPGRLSQPPGGTAGAQGGVSGPMDSSAGGYGARVQSQTSPGTFTGIGATERGALGAQPFNGLPSAGQAK